jgi:hypothetical protein
MEAVYKQYRKAGIVLPYLSNDASPRGHNAPGQPAPMDIYGHDGYPLGFDCSNPNTWDAKSLPTEWRSVHLKQSPNTPYAIPEFQGGSYDPWAGPGFARCAHLTGASFERVFYKNTYAAGVTIFNVYMTYGGTNWGNLGKLPTPALRISNNCQVNLLDTPLMIMAHLFPRNVLSTRKSIAKLSFKPTSLWHLLNI